MAFKSWDEIAPAPIVLSFKDGKSYTLPPVPAQVVVWLNAEQQGIETPLRGMSDEDQTRAVLGKDTVERMLADGCPREFIARAYLCAMIDETASRVKAEQVWESGVTPEMVAAVQKTAQEMTAAQGKTSTGTGSGGKTRSRASTSGTKSRGKQPKGSRGRGSSSTGAAS